MSTSNQWSSPVSGSTRVAFAPQVDSSSGVAAMPQPRIPITRIVSIAASIALTGLLASGAKAHSSTAGSISPRFQIAAATWDADRGRRRLSRRQVLHRARQILVEAEERRTARVVHEAAMNADPIEDTA
jgi:hypothetical protein